MLLQRRKIVSCTVFALAFFVLAASGLKADALAYATLQNSISDTFGTVDLNTGVFTAVNSSEPSQLQLASFERESLRNPG